MAKKEETKELVRQAPAPLAVPDFMKADAQQRVGLEHLKKEDLKLPRLALAQALSPQLSETESSYIENLKQGDMFNDLTSEVYGRGPFDVVVLRADPKRAMEFHPGESGGGVKDMNVPLDDPRCQWVDGEKPKATIFYDYIVMFTDTKEMIALSFKSSGLNKSARPLNSFMFYAQRLGISMFGQTYRLTAVPTKSAQGPYFMTYIAKGRLLEDAAEYAYYKAASDAVRGKELVITREPGDDSGQEDAPAL